MTDHEILNFLFYSNIASWCLVCISLFIQFVAFLVKTR